MTSRLHAGSFPSSSRKSREHNPVSLLVTRTHSLHRRNHASAVSSELPSLPTQRDAAICRIGAERHRRRRAEASTRGRTGWQVRYGAIVRRRHRWCRRRLERRPGRRRSSAFLALTSSNSAARLISTCEDLRIGAVLPERRRHLLRRTAGIWRGCGDYALHGRHLAATVHHSDDRVAEGSVEIVDKNLRRTDPGPSSNGGPFSLSSANATAPPQVRHAEFLRSGCP